MFGTLPSTFLQAINLAGCSVLPPECTAFMLGRCHSWGAPDSSSPAAPPASPAAQPHGQAPLIAELSLQLAWADGLNITPGLVLARGDGATAATLAAHVEWLM